MQIIEQMDKAILLFVQENFRGSFLDYVMIASSWIGDYGIVWIALGLFLIISRKTRTGGFDMLISLAFAAVLCNLILKNIISRPRPFLSIEELTLLISPLDSFSFPSGHACSSFAAATTLALFFRSKGALSFIPATLISVSRIYVGIHYPSDVFFGALIGVLVAWCIYIMREKDPHYIESKQTVENR